jgi:hypothetical protein
MMMNLFIVRLTIKTKILRLEINKISKIIFLKNIIIYKLKQLIFEIIFKNMVKNMSTPNFKMVMISFIILNN